MKFKTASIMLTACAGMLVAGCALSDQEYWQRVEDSSALYMTGPKAQQRLDEDISSCTNEIDELVKLDAMRGTTPPDTHNEYQDALKKSGDLASFDNPTRLGEKKVAHSDFYDYESCMRSKGWERVKFVRYQTASGAKAVYKETQEYRKTGQTTPSAPLSVGGFVLQE